MSSQVSRWRNGHDTGEFSGWSGLGLPLLAAAMDTAWIAPYSLLLGTAWIRPGLSLLAPVTIWLLLAVGQTVARRVLGRGGRPKVILTAAGAAAALLAAGAQYGGDPWWHTHGTVWHAADLALAQLRPELPAFIMGLLVWRRGAGIGRTGLEYYDVERIFYFGLVILGVFAAGTAFGRRVPEVAATASAALGYLLLFFATSLVALPLARLRSIRRQTQAGPPAVTVGRDWYGLIAGAVIAVLGLAVLTAVLLRLDLAAALAVVGRLIEPLIWAVLYVIAVPISFMLGAFVWALQRLLHPHAGQQPLRPLAPLPWLLGGPHQGPVALSPGAAAALRWGVASVIVLIILLWLSRALFRYDRLAASPAAEETHESVWSWAELKASLAAWLRRRPGRPAGRRAGPDFGSGAAAIVRRAYAEFLGLAAAHGTVRDRSQTPAEFAGRLAAAWPGAAQDARRLTAVYNRVRYGSAQPAHSDLAAVSDALAKIRTTLDDTGGGQSNA